MTLQEIKTVINEADASGYESKDAETIADLKAAAQLLVGKVEHLQTALESLIDVYTGANHPDGPIGFATIREARHALALVVG